MGQGGVESRGLSLMGDRVREIESGRVRILMGGFLRLQQSPVSRPTQGPFSVWALLESSTLPPTCKSRAAARAARPPASRPRPAAAAAGPSKRSRPPDPPLRRP
jgi:hypothetical protein